MMKQDTLAATLGPPSVLKTKNSIEVMIEKTYLKDMCGWEGKLSGEEILAALSYIESTWSNRIQRQHGQINSCVNAR